jgi:hypothetical protein
VRCHHGRLSSAAFANTNFRPFLLIYRTIYHLADFEMKRRESSMDAFSNCIYTLRWVAFLLVLVFSSSCVTPTQAALQVVLAGGTGPIGQGVAARCHDNSHAVTILTRNAFLAAAPTRVTKEFGWVGRNFLEQHSNVRLRDWDGGDLLDIVGQDWVGWQEDALKDANVVVHLVGGFTEQRVMATERLVRQSLICNRNALHVTVAPTLENLEIISPGMLKLKNDRILQCEDIVKTNCANHNCLRIEANRVDQECDAIFNAIACWKRYE